MRRAALALVLLAVACEERHVPVSRCLEACGARVFRSGGAPAADVVRDWVAFCERQVGACCVDALGEDPVRCEPDPLRLEADEDGAALFLTEFTFDPNAFGDERAGRYRVQVRAVKR